MKLSQNSFRTDLVFAAILLTAVVSVALYLAVGVVERAVVPWSPDARRRRASRSCAGSLECWHAEPRTARTGHHPGDHRDLAVPIVLIVAFARRGRSGGRSAPRGTPP